MWPRQLGGVIQREGGDKVTSLASLLYEPLSPHVEKIAGSAERQSVQYVESTWRAWLERAAVDPALADAVFKAIGPNAVSRQQLRDVAIEADSANGRLALLIAVL